LDRFAQVGDVAIVEIWKDDRILHVGIHSRKGRGHQSNPEGWSLCGQRPSRQELEAAELTDLPDDLVDIDILIGEPEFLGCGVGPRALVLLLAKLRSDGVGYAGLGTSSSNLAAIRAYQVVGNRPQMGSVLRLGQTVLSQVRDFKSRELGRRIARQKKAAAVSD
jgi:hypothetical protein